MRKLVASVVAAASMMAAAATADAGFSEIRVGVLAHDPLSQKEDGVDLNAEVFFNSWTEGSWELRPSIGVTAALEEDATSQLYIDLNYGGPISESWFLEFAIGGSVHDGKLETTDPDRKELGSRVLIHAAVSLGVMLTDNMSLSLYADHISNAGVEEHNEALETAGLRMGFRL